MPTTIMPKRANIPKNWCVHIDEERTVVIMPSRTIPDAFYNVRMNNKTRVLECDCYGFQFRGYCAHIAGLVWCCYKKAKKKGVQDTSMASFYSFSESELGERQTKVYHALLRDGPASNKQLARRMGWPINTITPRVKELREMGAVIELGKQHDMATNRDEMVWMALPGLVEK